MACGTFKDFIEILKAADQVLRDEAFSINKDPKYDVYQRELIQRSINVLIKNVW